MDMKQMKSGATFRGLFRAECFRKGKLIWTEEFRNIITNEGLNHMLDVTLHGKTLISPFYCVLYEDDEDPEAADDYAAPGFTETEAYDEGTRPEYNEAAASGQSITNSANKATFTFNASKTIYGAALMGGSNVKSNATDDAQHVMLCGAGFGTERLVVDDDVINLTYSVTAADDGV